MTKKASNQKKFNNSSPSQIQQEVEQTKSQSKLLKNQLDSIVNQYERQLAHLENLLMEKEEDLKRREIKVDEREKSLKEEEKQMRKSIEEEKQAVMKDLAEREERIHEIEMKLSKSTTIESKLGKNQFVKLNVGGKIFATNLETLKSVKDTFFTGYFNDHFNPQPEKEDNAYFIDRPCEQFPLILDYLRGIDIKHKIESFNENDLLDFIEEVVYYLITPIYDLLPKIGRNILKSKYGIEMENNTTNSGPKRVEFDPYCCSSKLKLETPTRIKKTGTREWATSVLGTKSNQFKVKFVKTCTHLMVGFAPKTIIVDAVNNYSKCGYFMYANDGTLYSQNRDSGRAYASCGKIQDGSIVECELKDGNISYIVNGTNYGVAYSNIPNEPELFPAFDVYATNCVFELINE